MPRYLPTLVFTAAAVAAAGAALTLGAATSPLRHPSARPAQPRPRAHLPIAFEANQGQSSSPVRFLARAGHATMYLTGSRVVLALRHGPHQDVVAMRFPGADPARVASERRLPGLSNYLVGADRRRWRTHVPQFGAVRYRRLYQGVDLVLHGAREGGLEYDFQVSPGGDPHRIRLALEGTRAVAIRPDGTLVMHLPHGDVSQPRPLAWQVARGGRTPVPVSYELDGTTVALRVGAYDPNRPLLIDPKLAYASYWGGSAGEGCVTAPGADASVYVACGTDSPDLPQVGTHPPVGQEDLYVAKLDRTATHILYATYLGSPGGDDPGSVAVDGKGHAYLSGFAGDGFPTTIRAYDRTFNGGGLPPDSDCPGCVGDAFVARLSRDGSRLDYSTYIGGSGAEKINMLALDRDRSVVITGFTGSADFPTTRRAVQRTFGGGTAGFEDVPADAFAVKLNPRGSRLVYSTYLASPGDDVGNDVAIDGAGSAYLTGFAESPGFPTTAGVLKTSLASGTLRNGYVTKLNRRGRLVWSTYLGGDIGDFGSGIDVGRHGDVYVSGSTRGTFPVTPGAAQPRFGGGFRDWFVGKLDPSGSSLEWATYLGGSDLEDSGDGVRVDHNGNAAIVGTTNSTDFPTTPDAFQPANAGGFDGAVIQLDPNGHVVFSSYLGGSGDEGLGGPTLDHHGNLYAGSVTSSKDFPVTVDAIQPSFGGGDIDGAIVKVALGHSRH
jgi:hypothetical protein